jgi:hypothetical protein
MLRETKIVLAALAVCVLTFAWPSIAGSINTFSTGETISASAMNANFNHIHNSMVGGHGARLVNADVSNSAAIAHSKLAEPAKIPKVYGGRLTACGSASCNLDLYSGLAQAFSRTATGEYTLTVSPARADASYMPFVVAYSTNAVSCNTYLTGTNATTLKIICANVITNVAEDSGFTVLILDNN